MTQNELVVIPGKPATVTQEELRRVASLWDQSEALAADIRRRLEAGAELEHGELGVAIEGRAVTGTVGSDSIAIGGIDIQPVEHYRAVLAEYPEFASETWI